MSAEAPKGQDWAQVREKLFRVANEKPTYLQSEIETGFAFYNNQGDHEGWLEHLTGKYPAALEFPLGKYEPGVRFIVGAKAYVAVETPGLSKPTDSLKRNILFARLAEDPGGKLLTLKRSSPRDALDFFLIAKELEESGVNSPRNAHLIQLDNPWIDTVVYDYIPGIPAHDYIVKDVKNNGEAGHVGRFLAYINEEIAALAAGKRLKNKRSYLPEDMNLSNFIVSAHDTDTPLFSLIDLEGRVRSTPYTIDAIADAQQTLMRDIRNITISAKRNK